MDQLPSHLASLFRPDAATGCHNWTGRRDARGYGRLGLKLAHRLAYEALRGAIPDGLVLDHLCRNPACGNPEHLEPVTQRENVLRGESGSAVNARKSACVRGHPFDAVNTYIAPRGTRECRACRREIDRRRNAARLLASKKESAK